jgi:hypothetical protein
MVSINHRRMDALEAFNAAGRDPQTALDNSDSGPPSLQSATPSNQGLAAPIGDVTVVPPSAETN